jgi:hypothetical protein
MNNEYVISFINENDVYQELTFRGVSEAVATALATGLNKAPFGQINLSVRELVGRPIDVPPAEVVIP